MGDQALNSPCINYCLADDLLLEIFLRLPSAESVTQCKCVCKLWCDLIYQSDFASRFIARKIIGNSMSKESERPREEDEYQEEQSPFAYCFQFSRRRLRNYGINPNDLSHKLSLSFVPGYDAREKIPITVNAWHNDLILCASPPSKELTLYLCNPRTKQCVQLPPPSRRVRPYLAGFIYDPHYRFDKENGSVTLRSSCRYSVCYSTLFEPGHDFRIPVEVFFSETGTWKRGFLVPPYHHEFILDYTTGFFTYKRMIHFYCVDAIVGFDPYKIREDGFIPSHFIRLPILYTPGNTLHSACFSVYGGRIRMVQYTARRITPNIKNIIDVGVEPHNTTYSIKLWELKNYDTCEWSLELTVYLQDLTSEDSNLTEYIKRGCLNSMAVLFHPCDPDTLLVKFWSQFAECNLKKKTLKPILHGLRPRFVHYGVGLPWWPSLLTKRV